MEQAGIRAYVVLEKVNAEALLVNRGNPLIMRRASECGIMSVGKR